MSTEVRQRTTTHKHSSTVPSSHLELNYGNHHDDDDEPRKASSVMTGPFLFSRKQLAIYLPLLMLVYVVGPTALHLPNALYIFASHGFDPDAFLGAGLRDLVGSMVDDPHQLMVGDVTPPTPLAAYKDVLLEEYDAYRQSHEIPKLAQMDVEEQGPLDPKGQWKTLFVKAMGRYTCAASHFPKTIEAVSQSGLTAYSIMFSRLAPGQKIEPHTGFSKMIQIYHLALKVPSSEPKPQLHVKECFDESGSAYDVNDEIYLVHEKNHNNEQYCREEHYEWTEGKEFIFDDSFTHWVENPTEEERIVMFMHIKRVDFKGWRESLIGGTLCYLFTWIPFESVMKLVRGTEATCALEKTQ